MAEGSNLSAGICDSGAAQLGMIARKRVTALGKSAGRSARLLRLYSDEFMPRARCIVTIVDYGLGSSMLFLVAARCAGRDKRLS